MSIEIKSAPDGPTVEIPPCHRCGRPSSDYTGAVYLCSDCPCVCLDCGYDHKVWLTCYSAAKQRFTDETGLDFWTREPVAKKRIDELGWKEAVKEIQPEEWPAHDMPDWPHGPYATESLDHPYWWHETWGERWKKSHPEPADEPVIVEGACGRNS